MLKSKHISIKTSVTQVNNVELWSKTPQLSPKSLKCIFLMMAVYSVCPIRCLREYTPRKDTDEDGGKVDTW